MHWGGVRETLAQSSGTRQPTGHRTSEARKQQRADRAAPTARRHSQFLSPPRRVADIVQSRVAQLVDWPVCARFRFRVSRTTKDALDRAHRGLFRFTESATANSDLAKSGPSGCVREFWHMTSSTDIASPGDLRSRPRRRAPTHAFLEDRSEYLVH